MSATSTNRPSFDVERVDHAARLLEVVASLLAADALGDETWNMDDRELRLGILRLVDAAARQLAWATT